MTFARLAALALVAGGLAIPVRAHAAQSYDNCAHFIDSVPATISTQGVWCLRQDLSTSISTGIAIQITTNNVTLDCNDFKLGGLGAGSASHTYGIYSQDRQNITVRNCSVRGFYQGIYVYGGAGHLVEHNRLDNNLVSGIQLQAASNSIVRDNRVYDTGGYPDNYARYGIYSYGGDSNEVSDNVVSGVMGTTGYFNSVVGIFRGNYIQSVNLTSARITGNRISGLAPTGANMTGNGFQNVNYGSTGGMIQFSGNDLFMTSPVAGSYGIKCTYGNISIRDNNIRGFPTAFDGVCLNDGGNISH